MDWTLNYFDKKLYIRCHPEFEPLDEKEKN